MSDVFNRLPEMCAHTNEGIGRPVLLKRGCQGYWPFTSHLSVEQFNRILGVTPAQVEAMYAGSMFGFHCPAADPRNYKMVGDRAVPDMSKIQKACHD